MSEEALLTRVNLVRAATVLKLSRKYAKAYSAWVSAKEWKGSMNPDDAEEFVSEKRAKKIKAYRVLKITVDGYLP